MSSSNLPFDVFADIFSFYEETPEQPLEILLLVCRSWKEAALHCRQIWSQFKIDLWEMSHVLFWAHRIPRRLERSGSYSPIRFSLRLREKYSNCNNPKCPRFHFRNRQSKCKCHTTVQDKVENILRALLGPDGSMCARWEEINIRGDGSSSLKSVQFLSYPTPKLRSLTLSEVLYQNEEINLDFLPVTPSLQEIKVVYCELPHIPNVENVVNFNFAEYYDLEKSIFGGTTSTSRIEDAHQVQRLGVDVSGISWDRYALPHSLLFLEELTLAGDKLPENIKQVQMPALRKLTIWFKQENDTPYTEIDSTQDYKRPIICLLKCSGIPFHQIDTLRIEFYQSTQLEMNDEDWSSYEELLRLCATIATIYGDQRSTLFILRLLRDDCIGVGSLIGRRVVVSNGKDAMVISSGMTERLKEIDTFILRLEYPEMADNKKQFLQQLSASQPYRHLDIHPFEI